ncbi:MAG: hypothetical protein ACRDZ7_15455 [Acidimicrobiia bacterium]
MIRTIRSVAMAAALIMAGVLLAPLASGDREPAAKATSLTSLQKYAVEVMAEDGSAYDQMAVNSRGKTVPENKDNRTILTFPMYNLATGEEIGTIIDDVQPNGPGTFDVFTTFIWPDGELTSHATVSAAQDPQKPGWIIVGKRAEGKNTITNATGVFAGRSGHVDISGTNDLTKFPAELYQDDFWVIKLNK